MTDSTSITLQITISITAVAHPEPGVGGYSAEVPALPGCYTQGETLDELRANIQDAAEAWLAVAHDLAAHATGQAEAAGKRSRATGCAKSLNRTDGRS